MNAILTALFLSIPLILSGSFHMLVVSKNWFSFLAIPINSKAFGVNKTWRGIAVMMMVTIPGVYVAKFIEPLLQPFLLSSIFDFSPWILGLLLGAGYVIPELPNSYVKRRFNILPGQKSGRFSMLFTTIDQADSAIGCAIVYYLSIDLSWLVVFWMVALGPLVHLIANLSLYSLGLRKEPL